MDLKNKIKFPNYQVDGAKNYKELCLMIEQYQYNQNEKNGKSKRNRFFAIIPIIMFLARNNKFYKIHYELSYDKKQTLTYKYDILPLPPVLSDDGGIKCMWISILKRND